MVVTDRFHCTNYVYIGCVFIIRKQRSVQNETVMFYALEFALICANRINAAKTQSRVKYAHYTRSAGNIYIYIYIYMMLTSLHRLVSLMAPGPCLNIKTVFLGTGIPKIKIIGRLYNGNSYTSKPTSLYRDGPPRSPTGTLLGANFSFLLRCFDFWFWIAYLKQNAA